MRENIGYWIQYKFRIQTDVYELPNDRIDKLEKATFKLSSHIHPSCIFESFRKNNV